MHPFAKARNFIRDKNILVEMFTKHYVNIAEKISVIILKQIGIPSNPNWDAKTVNKVIENYEDHPSNCKIKKSIKEIKWIYYLGNQGLRK